MKISADTIDFKNHPVTVSGQAIQEIIAPLLLRGLNGFSYGRLDSDGGKILLRNMPCFFEKMVKEKLYRRVFNGKYDEYQSGYFLGDLLKIDQRCIEISRAYDFGHLLILIRKHPTYTEQFCFSAPLHFEKINQIYINNFDFFSKFTDMFLEKAALLIKAYEPYRIFFHDGNDMSGLLNQPLDLSASSPQHYTTHPPLSTILSAREIECAKHTLAGKSMKEMACNMNISSRTVETYIESAKRKLGCHKKTDFIITLLKFM